MDESERGIFKSVVETTPDDQISSKKEAENALVRLSNVAAILAEARRPETATHVLDEYKILQRQTDDEADALHALFEGSSLPQVDLASVRDVLEMERQESFNFEVALPEQPIVVMNNVTSRILSLLTAGYPARPALLRLPPSFSAAFLRILIRLLSHESDSEYNEVCMLTLRWKDPNHPLVSLSDDDSRSDPDHATR